MLSGDSARQWNICETTLDANGPTRNVQANKAGDCYARVYTTKGATASTRITITGSGATAKPTTKPAVNPTVKISCTTPVKVGEKITCTASGMISGDSVSKWNICNTTFTASGNTKTFTTNKAGRCNAIVYTTKGAAVSTVITINSATAPTTASTAKPAGTPTVKISCNTPVKVGGYITCTASGMISGDSVRQWNICGTTFAASGNTKSVQTNKAGRCNAIVYTTKGASTSVVVTIESSTTAKAMNSLTYICNMGNLTIKDGTRELNWRNYCTREDISHANREAYSYRCSGSGSYTGTYTKTCSM
jgi:hypothetical protein